jgi:HSP20 family molecular chaperone IbpA
MKMRYTDGRNHDVLSDMFDDMFRAPMFGGEPVMRTDVHEKDGKYVLDIEVPGYKKNEVKISLYNGNLTIKAEKNADPENKEDAGKILHQEIYNGTMSRTFYVGDAIKDSDIHAEFADGILHIDFPTEQKKEEDTKKFIEIL